MASVQCQRSYEQQQHSSLGQKVSELFKGHHHQHHNNSNNNLNSTTSATSQQCRAKKEHNKKKVFQKIKDGLSGHSSDSGGSSDSDHENCHNRKN